MDSRVKIACTALSAGLALFLIAGVPVVYGHSKAPVAHGNSKAPGHSKDKNHATPKDPIVLEKMGSMFVGGSTITAPGTYDPLLCGVGCPTPDGQTLHVDHLYAQYKIPVKPKKLPLVMWHGCLSTAYESTPDDREGYESIFVRRGWSTYIIDQPRQGRAGKSSAAFTYTPNPGDFQQYHSFRLGVYPNFFPGSQFPHDPASLDHFFRQGAPNGPGDLTISTDAVAALFNKIGPAILITHSASGPLGLLTAMKTSNIKGIVSYEPSNSQQYPFPVGELPTPLPLSNGTPLAVGLAVPLSDFLKLTKIPIQFIFGDNIPTSPNPIIALDNWRVRLVYAQQLVDKINEYGGDAQLVHLPDIGIHGNSHFAFADLNNLKIADLLSAYLKRKRLDK